MKKINITLLFVSLILLGVLVTQATYAVEPSGAKPAYMKQLEKVIKDAVKYPDFKLTKEERGDITVTFSLTDDGKIKVEKVSAPSPRIEEYVKKQLTDVSAKDVIHPYQQLYKVSFRFENV